MDVASLMIDPNETVNCVKTDSEAVGTNVWNTFWINEDTFIPWVNLKISKTWEAIRGAITQIGINTIKIVKSNIKSAERFGLFTFLRILLYSGRNIYAKSIPARTDRRIVFIVKKRKIITTKNIILNAQALTF